MDIDWMQYDFQKHLEIARCMHPLMTVAQDIMHYRDYDRVLGQARALAKYCKYVVIVPKDKRLVPLLEHSLPHNFILGFSVPTRYGNTPIPPEKFAKPVHLLGGRPDIQRQLANLMPVVSFDCNRFTLDAAYGDYFDGEIFRPHPLGGYIRCITDSIRNINRIWEDYCSPYKLELK